jgi:hypothetical protein
MENWKGVVIAESLDNPTIINRFPVERALISKPFEWIPYKGAQPFSGRWHLYRVCCDEKDLDVFQHHIQPGWFTHFWSGETLMVIFNDKRFEAKLNDRATWTAAIAHGHKHNIPPSQLDFEDI